MADDTVAGLGQRIRELRTDARRGQMTQTTLAAAANCSVDVIRKLEQGAAYTTSIPTLHKIARALDVEIVDLFARPRARLTPGRRSGAVALRRAVVSVDDLIGDDPDIEPLTLEEARRTVGYGWVAYWGARTHDVLPTILPEAFARLRATLREVPAADRAAAHDLAAQLYQVAACTLVHLGYSDTAYQAVREALRLAEHGFDPLRVESLQGTMSWLLLNQGRFEESHRLATMAAAAVAPKGDSPLPHWTLYGSLLITGASAAARDQDRPKALVLLGEAREAAALTGTRNDYETAWGPDQVQMQYVDTAVVTENYVDAIDEAAKMPERPQLPVAARSRHLADTALSHTRLGHDEAALHLMMRIHQDAPQWVQGQRMAQVIIRALWERSSPPEQLQGLARTAGLLR